MRRRAVLAQAASETRLGLRRGESLVVTIGIPVGVLLFFGKVQTPSVQGDPLDFLVPGVLALAVMSSAMVSLGIATGFDRRFGVLKRLGSTPLTRGGLLAAKTLYVLAIEAIQLGVLLTVAAALGWRPGGSVPLALLALLVGTVAFAGLGLLLAGTLRAEANLALANGLYLVLLFLGGMAYPLTRLPDAVQSVARLLPAAALAETVRGALADPIDIPVGAVTVLVVWSVLLPLVAARCFRWEE
ncbi:MAG: ABC transporter permease [Actinomycetes bacterium]